MTGGRGYTEEGAGVCSHIQIVRKNKKDLYLNVKKIKKNIKRRFGKRINIPLDGHNRYKICTENGIEFQTVDKPFADRTEVLKWIYENQLGRRNLTDFSRVELKVKYGDILQRAKENMGGFKGNQYVSAPLENSPKDQTPINTREEISKETGVPEWQTRQSLEIIKKGTEEQKQRAREGEKLSAIVKEIKGEPETKICISCGQKT